MSGRAAKRSLLGKVVSAGCYLTALGTLVVCAIHASTGDGVMVLVWFHTLGAWFAVPLLLVLPIVLVRAKWRQLILVAIGLVWCGWFNRPPLGRDDTTGTTFRLASANVLMVNERPEDLVAELVAADPHVLVYQEYTPGVLDAMSTPENLAAYPHRAELPATHSFGAGLYSKSPIEVTVEDLGGVDLLRAVTTVEGRRVEVWNVHLLPPFTGLQHQTWLEQVQSLKRRADSVEHPLVVAGDFNLTRHHAGYSELTEVLDDAHRRCGRWVAWTWPQRWLWFFPKVRIDHVFLRGDVRCASIREGVGARSDHRPILVELRL